jgi:thioredoxin-like negative regulator of GroEL
VQAQEWPEARDAASRALALSVRLGARHLESLAHYWLAEALLGEFEIQSQASATAGQNSKPAASQTPPAAAGPAVDGAVLQQARAESEAALQLATDIGLAEVDWRARGLLARIEAASDRQEQLLRAAVSILETLRSALTEAGIPDTLLENDDCATIYVRLARLLHSTGRLEETQELLDQIGWPPLTNQLNAEWAQVSTPT